MSSEQFFTREQTYASRVYALIKPLSAKDEAERKAYGSLAHKLPILIRTAGLAQALAFVAARNKEGTPQRRLLAHLEEVLQQTNLLAQGANLVERSRTASFEEYMRLTEGSLQALLWFKRFAQAELKVEAGTEEEGR
ncbi:MAG: type III-B CRISPR module-associated protein Cmr5 [Candidatus Viridilinea halotolerans]|uniref:CRISPR type III-B/RAMP module-associated protein Cmr5 n=1 Tax=Candidatus Viridilinea halotolerans TaxID=2491704 RepID=A0A426TY77_9CHLR|nr:MAG: type III-B CRISPR module-associated protein Cmr5 [Candidatus Viridilinea halotolerans]